MMPAVASVVFATTGVAVAEATSGIPYRVTSAVPAGSLVTAVLATLTLLGVLVAGLLLARRRGWLQAWFGNVAPSRPMNSSFRVTAKLRVSATTRAYTVECGAHRYLLVESSQHVVIQPQIQIEPNGSEHAGEA